MKLYKIFPYNLYVELADIAIYLMGLAEIQGIDLGAEIIRKVEILGHDGSLEWKKDGEGLHISAPGFRSDMPAVIKVTIE